MRRYLDKYVKQLSTEKIVLLTGARQCGKPALAKQFYSEFDYFNFDAAEDRLALKQKSWDRTKPLIIFDELHKMREWKRWIKGVYDKEGIHHRLYPLDLKEVAQYDAKLTPDETFQRLWNCSGFPEPFLKGDLSYYRRWRREHLDIILRQDLIDLHLVRDIQAIETLVQLLKTRVGAGISYANLARDIERDTNTIKRWLQLLENLYLIFRITPYHKNVARSLLKEPKYYFFDIAQVDEPGARLENIVALSLLKELHFIEDTTGKSVGLNYLRTKEGKEVDFVVCIEGKPKNLIEVKLSDSSAAPALSYFSPLFPGIKAIQLVKDCEREKTFPNGVEIRKLIPWLTHLNLNEK